jgi:hypothetical protein
MILPSRGYWNMKKEKLKRRFTFSGRKRRRNAGNAG